MKALIARLKAAWWVLSSKQYIVQRVIIHPERWHSEIVCNFNRKAMESIFIHSAIHFQQEELTNGAIQEVNDIINPNKEQ